MASATDSKQLVFKFRNKTLTLAMDNMTVRKIKYKYDE